jgi:hypothetical protein
MQLSDTLLSPRMRRYFELKLLDVAAAEVAVRIEETLRFLALARFCRGAIPVTQEIDDVWHLWILETQEYAQLCARLPGGQFLHHSSKTYAECASDGGGGWASTPLEEDVAMLGAYVANYGPFEAGRVPYWLLAAHLVERCGMTVAELNEWLVGGTSRTTTLSPKPQPIGSRYPTAMSAGAA